MGLQVNVDSWCKLTGCMRGCWGVLGDVRGQRNSGHLGLVGEMTRPDMDRPGTIVDYIGNLRLVASMATLLDDNDFPLPLVEH